MALSDPSEFANRYLIGLKGLEIGGGAHNPFYLDTVNADKRGVREGYAELQVKEGAVAPMPVDHWIEDGSDLSAFDDNSFDFVLASHVIEHIHDPILALREWMRVASRYIFLNVPDMTRTDDAERPLTSIAELADRAHQSRPEVDAHYNVWTRDTFLELLEHLGFGVIAWLDPDDKCGNGFMVLIDAGGYEAEQAT